MFGKRGSGDGMLRQEAPRPAQPVTPAPKPAAKEAPRESPKQNGAPPSHKPAPELGSIPSPPIAPVRQQTVLEGRRSESFYETKGQIFGALIEAIDLTQLSKLDPLAAREEIRDIVNEIIAIKNVAMSISEQ
jgi:pilus assembly protein CpaF